MKNKLMRVGILVAVFIVLSNIFVATGLGKSVVYNINNFLTSVTTSITDAFDNIGEGMKSNKDLRLDNSILTSDNKVLTRDAVSLRAKIKELEVLVEQLTKSINSTATLKRNIAKYNGSTNFKLLDGQIISRNISDWNNKASINLGSNDGIKVGNAVLYDGILFGFVEKVEKNESLVKLTTSENMKINIPSMVYKDKKEFNGILLDFDADTNRYSFKSYSTLKELSVGDKVYTNGYSRGVPKGIEIGTILEVIKNNNNLEVIYKVKPSAELYDARYIQVIK